MKVWWLVVGGFVVALAVCAVLLAASDAFGGDRGWDRHRAPWSEDSLLSRCVHRAEGNYVVWLYNGAVPDDVDDLSFFVVPLPEGRPCR